MISRTCVSVVICTSLLFLIQALLPKVTALQKTSNVDEFMVEDQRTHTRQNYVVQRALDNEILSDVDNIGVAYATESFEPDINSEELPALIVDYANMIRNDIILLDNSVETRTRKRGNIKVEKYNQNIPDPPCNCEYSKEPIDLGEDRYPRYIETRNCNKKMCPPPYVCQESLYNMTILVRRRKDDIKTYLKEEFITEIPNDLKHRWIAVKKPVTIGCVCTRDYIKQI